MTDVILWDWDNTLVDTFDVIWHAQNDMRQRYGLPAFTKEQSKMAMNKSGRNLIADWVGVENAAEARKYYLSCYAHYSRDLELKENARSLLNWTKDSGFYNILASNKEGALLRKEVERLSVLDAFDRLIGAGVAAEDKPSKIFTDEAIKGLHVDRIISIGDGASDVKMGHNYENGVSILVFTNPKSKEFENNCPDYAAVDLDACQRILEGFIPPHRTLTYGRVPPALMNRIKEERSR